MAADCPRCCACCAKWMPLSKPSARIEDYLGDFKEVYVYDIGVCAARVERDYLMDIRGAKAPVTTDALVDMVDYWVKAGSDMCLGYKAKEAADD